MKQLNPFTRHPAAVGESYWTHMAHAAGFGLRMLVAAVAMLIHAVLPFLLERTGSRAVRELHDRMEARTRDSHATETVTSGRRYPG